MIPSADCRSLVELLRRRAAGQPDVRAYTFLVNGEAEGDTITYGELDRRSRAVAAALQRSVAAGERVLLLYPPGLEFLGAFFGCLYAGVVAVPTYPPHPLRPARSLPRLHAIAGEAGVRAILCSEAMAASGSAIFGEVAPLAGLPVLATGRLAPEDADSWKEPGLEAGTLAFLQYTSGSTAAPKGVMVSHANVLHNLAYIASRAGVDGRGAGVSWLPVHHDMGLLGGLLLPLFAGFPSYLMAPASFVQKPLRWLEAISRYRACLSGGPNFAYDFCVNKTTPDQRQRLDLGCWRVAYNGAEPIRQGTLEGFQRAFGPCGFRSDAFCLVYGLAEATLLVSGVRQRGPTPETGTEGTSVSCGRPAFGTEVVIADPQSRTQVRSGEVGEIWVSSPSVAQGYWNRPEETGRTFHAYLADTGAGPWLRTGDLGCLREGELVVTGRIKDLLIIRGRKHYPQDLERTVESSHPALQPNGAAAMSLPADEGERLLIVAEIHPRLRGRVVELADVVGTIRQAVAEQHELQTHTVLLVLPGGIPRTTSGKLQRHACRQSFLDGKLAPILEWPGPAEPSRAARPRRQPAG